MRRLFAQVFFLFSSFLSTRYHYLECREAILSRAYFIVFCILYFLATAQPVPQSRSYSRLATRTSRFRAFKISDRSAGCHRLGKISVRGHLAKFTCESRFSFDSSSRSAGCSATLNCVTVSKSTVSKFIFKSVCFPVHLERHMVPSCGRNLGRNKERRTSPRPIARAVRHSIYQYISIY